MINELKKALTEAIKEIKEHNAEYQYVTPEYKLTHWEKLVGVHIPAHVPDVVRPAPTPPPNITKQPDGWPADLPDKALTQYISTGNGGNPVFETASWFADIKRAFFAGFSTRDDWQAPKREISNQQLFTWHYWARQAVISDSLDDAQMCAKQVVNHIGNQIAAMGLIVNQNDERGRRGSDGE